MKRIASVLLALVFVLTLLPIQVFAREGPPYEVVVDDADTGTGLFQLHYNTRWGVSTGLDTAQYEGGTEHWTNRNNAQAGWSYPDNMPTFTMKFYGHKVAVYGVKAPGHGIAEVSIDGGAPMDADFYATARTYKQEALVVDGLAEGEHLLSFTLANRKNDASTGVELSFDYIKVWHNGLPPTGISINEAGPIALEEGATKQLTATVTPEGSLPDVEWASSAPGIADVDATGLVTAVSEGSAAITATAKNTSVSASVQVEVTGGTVYTKKVEDSVGGDGMFQFAYTGTWGASTGVAGDSNGDESWTNKTRWQNDPQPPSFVFEFYGNAVRLYGITAPGHGIALVSIDGGAPVEVDFYSAARAQQQLVFTADSLTEGEHTLHFILADRGTGTGVDVALDFAEVDHRRIPVTGVAMDTDDLTLAAGLTYQLSAEAVPAYATDISAFEWASSNEEVATVSADGLVETLAAGVTTVSVKLAGTTFSDSFELTVRDDGDPIHASWGSTDRHYLQSDYNSVLEMGRAATSDIAWKGDRLLGELVVLSKNVPVTGLTATVSDFTSGGNVIPAANADIQYIQEVKAYIGRGGSWNLESRKEMVPDIIYGALPVDVAASRVQPLWFSLDVPEDAAPGLYEGVISLSCDGMGEPMEFSYAFEVLDLVQPGRDTEDYTAFGLELWQYPYGIARYYGVPDEELFGEKHLALLRDQLQPYKEAGGDAITVSIVEEPWNHQTWDDYPSMIKWTRKADGTFSFDYTHFDKYVEFCLGMGIDKQIKSFSMVPWNNQIAYYDEAQGKQATVAPSPGSATWVQFWDAFLTDYVAHLDEKGWFDITYIAMDERSLSDMNAVINILQNHPNQDGKTLKLSGAMNYNGLSSDLLDKIDDISINLEHAPHGNDTLRDLAEARRAKGLTTTLYTCVGDYPSSFARSNPSENAWTMWYAAAQKTDGFMRWAYDAWVEEPLVDISYKYWESGDPWMVYPGDKADETPLPRYTPRYERLMQGVRDVNKARWLAGQDDQAAVEVDELLASLGRRYGTKNSYGAMEAGSQANKDFIDAEVNRMRAGVAQIAKDFIGRDEPGPEPNPNLALNKTATASGVESGTSFTADKAVDGNHTGASRWSSPTGISASRPQWWQVDLGESHTIGQVDLYWENRGSVEYQVLVGNNPEDWSNATVIFEGGEADVAPTGPVNRFIKPDAPAEGRYVRVYITQPNSFWSGVSFYEVEVYGSQRDPGAEDLVRELENPVLSADGKSVVHPASPHPNFTLELIGSDSLPVIGLDGGVTTPLVDKTVNLLYRLTNKYNAEDVADSPNLTVDVPGKQAANTGNPEPVVIPSLREWIGGEGSFAAAPGARLVVDPASKDALAKAAETTKADFEDLMGYEIEVVYGEPQAGDIYLALDDTLPELDKEGYYMTVGDYVEIKAYDMTGAFFGTRSVLQALKASDDGASIAKGTARDYPKYEQRGFSIDVGRKFYTLEFLQDYVKLMSWYKLNTFSIHLNDNGFASYFGGDWDKTYSAFRLESDVYPGLTSTDGSYTKEEFRDLQYMALDYGVEIIPEIDTPAHSLAFTKFDNKLYNPAYDWDHIDVTNPYAYEFMEKLFVEYMEGDDPVFLNKVHIGTDEFDRSSELTRESFRKYTSDLLELVKSYGKKPYMWGSLTWAYGSTPVDSTGVTAYAWYNGYGDPKEMVADGFDLICIPDGQVYIVPEAGYYGNYLNVQNLYNNWEPNNIAGQVFPFGHPQIKGGMFAIWNDIVGNGISMDDSHDRIIHAMPVIAEKAWQGVRADVSYNEFAAKPAKTGEAPNANVSAKLADVPDNKVMDFNFTTSFDSRAEYPVTAAATNVELVRDDDMGQVAQFNGGESYIETSIDNLGFGWTVTMDIKPDAANPQGAVLFESDRGVLKLVQDKADNAGNGVGKLGFSKENYNHWFDYEVPADTWTTVTLTGNNTGTSLYINGEFVERLQGNGPPGLTGADGKRYMQTLVLPTARIGSKTNAFSGLLDNVKVFNKVCSDAEIAAFHDMGDVLDVNVALNKEASASSVELNLERLQPKYAFDGDTTNQQNRWASGYSNDEWITVDLGAEYEIYKARIYWENSYGKEYKLQYSLDGESFTDLVHRTNFGGGVDTMTFEPVTARYVKMQGIQRASSGYGYSIYEMEVYSKVDKTALRGLLRDIEEAGLNAVDYTGDSWNAFAAALAQAENVADSLNAMQDAVDKAYTDLETALAGLVPVGGGEIDIDELKDLYLDLTDGIVYKPDSYTASTWNRFAAALEKAKAVLAAAGVEVPDPVVGARAEPTKAEISAAYDELMAAWKALALRGDVVTLQVFYDSFAALPPERYTSASWKVMAEALAAAKAVLDDPAEATVEAVSKALDDLLAAQRGLEFATPIGLLEDTIEAAEALLKDKDQYISSAVRNLEKVLEEARALLKQEEITQEEIAGMVKKIVEATSRLFDRGDITSLKTLVGFASRLKDEHYTTSSWAAFVKELNRASTALEDDDLLQEELDVLYNGLMDAIGKLVTAPNKSGLGTSIALAETIWSNKDSYVAGTLEGLQEALDAAKMVYNDGDATPSQVNAAQNALMARVVAVRKPANKEALKAALGTGSGRSLGSLAQASTGTLEEALKKAAVVASDADATQQQVDKATAAIKDAVEALVPRAQLPLADRQKAVAKAADITGNAAGPKPQEAQAGNTPATEAAPDGQDNMAAADTPIAQPGQESSADPWVVGGTGLAALAALFILAMVQKRRHAKKD